MKSFPVLLALGAASGVAADVSPVTKVVTLLKELKAKVESDGESEQNTYNKFACWCEETTHRKADVIHQAKKDIQRLGNQVLEGKGNKARLESEIAQHAQNIADLTDENAKSTALRQKQNASFQQEKAEMEQTLNALQRAVAVLSGAGGDGGVKEGAAIKSAGGSFLEVKQLLRAAVATNAQRLSSEALAQVKVFLAESSKAGYNPQSATITGILKDMYTTFSQTLQETTDSDLGRTEHYEELFQANLDMVASETKEQTQAQKEHAETSRKLAEDQEALENTTERLNDAADFFDATRESCTHKSNAWTERSRLRVDEMAGIDKALKILNNDKARNLFSDAIKPGQETVSFLELVSSRRAANRAYRQLQQAARAAGPAGLRIAAIAVAMKKTGHFEAVIGDIANMVGTLQQEQRDDQSKFDNCTDKLHEEREKKAKEEHHIRRNDNKIQRHQNKIDRHQAKIEELIQLIEDQNQLIRDLDAQRGEEKTAFDQAQSDDKAAIDLLEKATKALAAYGAEDQETVEANKAFVQSEQDPDGTFEVSEDQAPEAEFSGRDNRAGPTKGVVSLLEMITGDLHNEVKQDKMNEDEAKAAHKRAVDDANNTIDALTSEKTNNETSKATEEKGQDDEENAKTQNETDLKNADDAIAERKPGCDWIHNNFHKRQENRDAEIEGLRSASSILSGMQTSLVQTFDDQKLGSLKFSKMASGGFLKRRN